MNGGELPLVGRSDAAPQLRQTGHSCIVQHVLGPNDRNAGQSELSLQVRNRVRLKSRAVAKGGLRTFAAPAN
jgi:hypothetical protein